MDINKEYKQISVYSFSGNQTNYDALKEKVVDKVGFTNRDECDCQFLIITFTDKTFIAVGIDYNNSEYCEDEPQLDNYSVLPPQNINGGNYRACSWIDSSGKIHFENWINILRDIGIWQFSDVDATKIIEQHKKDEEDREYQKYLQLKAKFEPLLKNNKI